MWKPFLLLAFVSFGVYKLTTNHDNITPPFTWLEPKEDVITHDLQQTLSQAAPELDSHVISNLVDVIEHVDARGIDYHHIVSVIDYSRPSNEKRLWVFDLNTHQLLFNTYVSHGLKSGTLMTNLFSNRNNSKASSLGVYRTEKSYYGRQGISLKLEGLELGFNDNAANRAIVMHGGWYVNEPFIQKYGRAGRSWGCPALPSNLAKPIINCIKDQTLLVAYYPDETWLKKSQFLSHTVSFTPNSIANQDDDRDNVLFVSSKGNRELVLVVSADDYKSFFLHPAPLNRMLRRQINQIEYIALSDKELNTILENPNSRNMLDKLIFVKPEVRMVRGYYATEMMPRDLGKIDHIQSSNSNTYQVSFENKPGISLETNHHFIRWLGL